MKSLLLILSLFISITAYSQDTTTVENITETERIIDKYGDKIITSFNEAVASITPVAEKGFEIVVKLQIAKGVSNFFPFILFIIFAYLFNKEHNYIANNESRPSPDYGPFYGDNVTGKLVFLVISVTITALIVPFTIKNAILYLIAPEWFAIKEILELF